MAADIASIAQVLDATLDHKQHRKGNSPSTCAALLFLFASARSYSEFAHCHPREADISMP